MLQRHRGQKSLHFGRLLVIELLSATIDAGRLSRVSEQGILSDRGTEELDLRGRGTAASDSIVHHSRGDPPAAGVPSCLGRAN